MTDTLDIGDEVEAFHSGEWHHGTIVDWCGSGYDHAIVLLEDRPVPVLRPPMRLPEPS